MKKYLVSLALKVPCNFEVEVEAKTKAEALEKAMDNWDVGTDEKNITDPDWNSLELDINNFSNINKDSNGVWIEEIE